MKSPLPTSSRMKLKKLNPLLKKLLTMLFISLGILAGSFLAAQNEQGNTKKKSDEIQVEKDKDEKTFRVDFRNKDIQDFLKAMSAIIGKNIITDDSVKGNITVISPQKLPVSKAYNYLTSVLAVKGFGVVEEGDLLKVITMKDAIAKGQEIRIGREAFPEEDLEKDRVVTHIVNVVGNKPSRLATVLKRVTNTNTDLVDYDELDLLILTGGAYEVNRLVKIIAKIDVPGGENPIREDGSSENIQIYYVENLEAEKIEATLRRIPLPEKGGGQPDPNKPNQAVVNPGGKPGQIEIYAHKESNSIIFIGTKEEFEPIRKLIQQIDVPRDQVLLEVLIVEIAATDEKSFGIDWRINKTTQFNTGIVAGSGLVDSKGDITGVNTLVGFSLGFLQTGSETALGLLNANVNNKNFSVLSAPQILTVDNQEAEINVGQDVPVLGNQRTSGGGDNLVTIQSFEYRPTGVKLKFTPKINKYKMITMDLFAEIKDIASVSSDATQQPTFTKRDLKSTIRVRDNQTIVIGGLVSKNKTKSVRKIPVLGDLPILGYLFKRISNDQNRTNLLVFITPHIVTSKDVADKITDELLKDQSEYYNKREKAIK